MSAWEWRGGGRSARVTLEAADLRVPVPDTDRDNDGHIEEKELSTVMRIMGMEPSDAQLRELIKSVDFDNNGKIEFEEFATLMARRMLVSDGDFELKQAFKLFDVDENGRLSVEEVRAMFMYDCGTDGLKLGDVDELVRLADPDGSGWVTVEEFVNMPCWQLPPMPLRERENPAKGAAEASSGTYRHVSR